MALLNKIINLNGFKETELGPLPEDWKVTGFGKCINKKRIKVGKIKQQEFKKIGKYPIVDQGQNLIAGYCDDEEEVYKGNLPIIIFGDHTRILKFIEFPFVCGADGTKVIVPNLDVVNPKFFYFALKSIDIPSRGYNRHYSSLKEKSIPLPPLYEQQKIAAVLSAVQEAKEKTDQVINATKELKKSMMKPEHWEVVRLGDVFELKQGKQLSAKESTEGKIKKSFLRTSNILWGKVAIEKVDEMFFTPEVYEKLKLKNGDVLVCEGGDIGRTALYREELEECAYQNHLHRLRPKRSNIMPLFFVDWMIFAIIIKRMYIHAANRTTIPNLSGSRLKNFIIPLPPLPEQQKIVSILSAIDQKIEAEESGKKALEDLFKSLLHNLMTAKIRVNNLEV